MRLSTFASAFLRNPLRIGAVAPSGNALGKAMARCVSPHDVDYVIELGSGNGAVTRHLAERFGARKIIGFELDERMAAMARLRAPGTRIVAGNAMEFADHVPATARLGIFSCLPILANEDLRAALLEAVSARLGPDDHFVQFTYAPFSPVRRNEREQHALHARFGGKALLNLPPATVWHYQSTRVPDMVVVDDFKAAA